MTNDEKIAWYCQQHQDEGDNCAAHARLLLPYISDYANSSGVDNSGRPIAPSDPQGCDFSPQPPGCPSQPAPAQGGSPGVSAAPAPQAPGSYGAASDGGACPAPSGGVQFVVFPAVPGQHVTSVGSPYLLSPSGAVAAGLLPTSTSSRGTVEMTYGSMSPVSGSYEISIGRCPGVIDPSVSSCYTQTTNDSDVELSWITKPTKGSTACLLRAMTPYFVNIRYTYSRCAFGTCGLSVQWDLR